MLLRSLNYLNDRHTITAGEAAYTSLIGTWTRKYPGGYWANNVSAPKTSERWPILLTSLQSHVVDTSSPGEIIEGLGVKLLEVVESDTDPVMDLAEGFQGCRGKVRFNGFRPIDYGFGVVIWATVSAGWVVMTRATWLARLP